MSATRERKERFILSFGKPNRETGNDAVSTCLRTYGLELFPDWALDEMVSDCISSERRRQRMNRENRRIYAAQREGQAA